MIRHIDDIGRIVIPKEIRYELDIEFYDGLNIYTENERIIITKTNSCKCRYCLTIVNKNDNYCRFCGKNLSTK